MADLAVKGRFNPWPATIFAILLVLAVLFLLPTVGVLLSSIKTTRDISMGDLWSLPASLYLGNFAEVLGNPGVHRYFLNTLLVTLPATAVSITLGALAADDRALCEVDEAFRVAQRSGDDMAVAFAQVILGVVLVHRDNDDDRDRGR